MQYPYDIRGPMLEAIKATRVYNYVRWRYRIYQWSKWLTAVSGASLALGRPLLEVHIGWALACVVVSVAAHCFSTRLLSKLH